MVDHQAEEEASVEAEEAWIEEEVVDLIAGDEMTEETGLTKQYLK